MPIYLASPLFSLLYYVLGDKDRQCSSMEIVDSMVAGSAEDTTGVALNECMDHPRPDKVLIQEIKRICVIS